MKKIFAIVFMLLQCVTLSACIGGVTGDAASYDTSEVFQVGDYPILITTPNGWEEEADPGNLDLQCISPKHDVYISAYGYSALDLAEEQTAKELFELQTAELFSARDNAAEMEPISMTEDEEKVLYRNLYSAERDDVKNYYQLFFIHFKNTGDMAWIMINGMPSIIEKSQDTIEDIIAKVQNSELENGGNR